MSKLSMSQQWTQALQGRELLTEKAEKRMTMLCDGVYPGFEHLFTKGLYYPVTKMSPNGKLAIVTTNLGETTGVGVLSSVMGKFTFMVEGEEFVSPVRSHWIVSVDIGGFVSILKAPNIHPSFFDAGSSAEDIGLPFECTDKTPPGVYLWICTPYSSTDWETGYVDDFGFEVEAEQLLWEIPQ